MFEVMLPSGMEIWWVVVNGICNEVEAMVQ
jgi:hypothetical protein